MKRLNDNSDAPEARHGTFPKIFSSMKKRTKLHSTLPWKNRYSRLIPLRQISGSNTMIGSQTKVGILGDPHLGLNRSNFLVQRCLPFFVACWKVNSLAFDGSCRQIHLPHATLSHVQSLHRTHGTDDMCTVVQGFSTKNWSFIHASWFTLCCTRH